MNPKTYNLEEIKKINGKNMKKRLIYTLALFLMTVLTFAQSNVKYEYDEINRLTKVTYSNGTVVEYTYDALGNRTEKEVTGGSASIVENAEPYAVLSNDNTVLTFYYDDQKEARGGMDVDGFAWFREVGGITTVMFDSSFANCKTITEASHFFYNCANLTSIIGIENLKTDNFVSMDDMFYNCGSLESVDISHFNTKNVTSMARTFLGCSSLKSLDVSHFDTKNVTNMLWMFCGCSNLNELDVTNFNTENVNNMFGMFMECSGLTSLDVTNFNTGQVTNMAQMFQTCTNLTSLDLTNFDTEKVNEMSYMFSSCTNLETIYCNDTWNPEESNSSMFYGCINLKGAISYDENNTGSAYANPDTGYFTRKESQTIVENAQPYAVLSNDNTLLTFYYDDQKEARGGMEANIYPWIRHAEDIKKVVFDASFDRCSTITNTSYWFYKCENLTEIIGIEYLHTENVTDMSQMFYFCTSLKNLDVSHFNTSKVERMDWMFYYCSSLESLDVSHFDTRNVTNMTSMFADCSNLTSLDVSHFNTEKVTDMLQMFTCCYNVKNLDLTNFDTRNVTNMSHMLSFCKSLEELDLSNFDTSNVTDAIYMFRWCENLKNLHLSSTMSDLDDDACDGVGTEESPCTLIAPDGFEFGVDTSGDTFVWKGGYFTLKVEQKKGDANGDGTVDASDIVEVLNYILNKPSEKFNFNAADVNGDGAVNPADIVGISNIILGNGTAARQ